MEICYSYNTEISLVSQINCENQFCCGNCFYRYCCNNITLQIPNQNTCPDVCTSYYDSNQNYMKAQLCLSMPNMFCCGNCLNKYCCNSIVNQLNQSSCPAYMASNSSNSQNSSNSITYICMFVFIYSLINEYYKFKYFIVYIEQ